MQLLMLLAILAAMITTSLAARDERMNNVPGERKFLQHMREKRRVELFFLLCDRLSCDDSDKYNS
jgi:hypothetical protein